MARKQARVRVDQVAETGEGADRPRQELSERHDHAEIRGERAQRREHLGSTHVLGTQKRHPGGERARRDGRRRRLSPASACPVGLRHHADDGAGPGEQTFQRGDGEVGRSEEDEPQRRGQSARPLGVGGRSPAEVQPSPSLRSTFLRF